ncbi:4-diphosphocytidyl-2-C-methyl-D-erythritol kinase [Planctomycetes bacterium MalM25]|nr:4-diphosphocytidyl-2-C-methyl-D-erythritol kinase [Planctomycetes bacterium MalM25]
MTRPSRPNPLSCALHAPAKLNLCLELLGKRQDGFHELRTVMATLGLFDTLRFEANDSSDTITLAVDPTSPTGRGMPTDENNLIVKSLLKLRESAGVDRGAWVSLTKRIPHAAGLGGGSSDAAAALIAGNRIWSLGWSIDRLSELGGQLGSDIPFFVRALAEPRQTMALATGRGEKITPQRLSARRQPVVVLKPETGLATAEVYQACRPGDYGDSEGDRCGSLLTALASGNSNKLRGCLTNTLQAAALRVAPWLGAIEGAFERCGCAVHQLSGSGSAYFGVTRTMSEARRLAARLRAFRLGRVYTTTFG